MQAAIEDDGRVLRLGDGAGAARFHATWLWHNAPAHRDPQNGQRLITLSEMPRDIRLTGATATDGTVVCRFRPDAEARLAVDWLLAHRYDRPAPASRLPAGTEPWRGTFAPASARLDDLQSDAGARRRWLGAVARHGVARVSGLAAEPGALFGVIDLFGHVRETNYGRLFDVRAKAEPENLAYTGLGLQAHTDNPYRDPVPGLQLLACLENTVEGGESAVVDGFAAALRLEAEAPDAFALLTRHAVAYAYAGSAGVRLSARAPVIELDARGQLRCIRFNNRSLAPLDVPFEVTEPYFAALRLFSGIVDDPAMAVRFRLDPGQAFLVDNMRVMHARTAFSSHGTRRLQGCYADRDGLLSTLAALSETAETRTEETAG